MTSVHDIVQLLILQKGSELYNAIQDELPGTLDYLVRVHKSGMGIPLFPPGQTLSKADVLAAVNRAPQLHGTVVQVAHRAGSTVYSIELGEIRLHVPEWAIVEATNNN